MKIKNLLAPLAILALVVTTGAAAVTLDGHKSDGQKEAPKTDKHDEAKKDGDKDKKEARSEGKTDDAAILNAQRWSYPMTTCPISGEKLEDKHVDFVVSGRMVRTCCDRCKEKVMKDPSEAFKKIDAAVIAAQKADYPLTTCPVSGEKLEAKAVDKVHGTRLVRFCCDNCVKEFEKDPKAVMAKVDEAYIKAQKANYPIKKCLVSGEELGGMGEAVDKLYGTTLVRFCCNSCVKTFEKDSDKFLKQLADARKPAK